MLLDRQVSPALQLPGPTTTHIASSPLRQASRHDVTRDRRRRSARHCSRASSTATPPSLAFPNSSSSEQPMSHDSWHSESGIAREAGATPDPLWHSGPDTPNTDTAIHTATPPPMAIPSSVSSSEEAADCSNAWLPVLTLPYLSAFVERFAANWLGCHLLATSACCLRP